MSAVDVRVEHRPERIAVAAGSQPPQLEDDVAGEGAAVPQMDPSAASITPVSRMLPSPPDNGSNACASSKAPVAGANLNTAPCPPGPNAIGPVEAAIARAHQASRGRRTTGRS